jgi:hypothetical protein
MNTIQLNNNDTSIVDAIFTLISHLDKRLQKKLFEKIQTLLSSKEHSEKISHESAMRFLEDNAVKGGERVPSDDDGKTALIDFKY